MTTKTIFVFPGQGSQSLGMLASLAQRHPMIRETFIEASELLSEDLWRLCQQGPLEKLNQTVHTQPILLTASVALWRLWQQQGGSKPLFMAGHSLGEYAALVCAECFTFAAAVRLVAERGRLMQAAVPEGMGAMAAIIGLDPLTLTRLCHELVDKNQVLAPANYNAPGQVVVAGHAVAIDKLVESAKQYGAKLAKRVPMSVPSHCPLMIPAAEQLKQYLTTVDFYPPKIPVVNNVGVCVEHTPVAIKEALVNQLFSPVRWVEIIQYLDKVAAAWRLESDTVVSLIECGPGKVLAGLNKRITTIPTLSIGEPEFFDSALKAEGVSCYY